MTIPTPLTDQLRAAANHPENWDVNRLLHEAANEIEVLTIEVADRDDIIDHMSDRIHDLTEQIQLRDDMIVSEGIR